jgi:hypothetical protein
MVIAVMSWHVRSGASGGLGVAPQKWQGDHLTASRAMVIANKALSRDHCKQ